MTKKTTTEEFAFRLGQAIDGHPKAPASPYGRQAWLRERLIKEANQTFSANTLHKWVNGTARPRPDAMRAIAQVLSVDEVWLALGHKSVAKTEVKTEAVNARGAALLVAGLVEMRGGRVTFPPADSTEQVSLFVNTSSGSRALVVVTPQATTPSGQSDTTISFLVPEPVGSARIIGVRITDEQKGPTPIGVDLLDLTDLPRQNLGGFSIVTISRTEGAGYTFEGENSTESLTPIETVSALA